MNKELIMRVFFLSFIILFPWRLLTFAKAVSSWSNMVATCFENIKWTDVTIRGRAMETLIPEPLIPAIFKPPPIKSQKKRKVTLDIKDYLDKKKRRRTVAEELGVDMYQHIDKNE